MPTHPSTLLFMLSLLLLSSLPAHAGWAPNKEKKREHEAAATIERFKALDSGLNTFFDQAYGYAVFPRVGKGGLVLGGAHGRGVVYKRGRLIGLTTLTQVTVGLQAGGQGYSEIIFFQNKAALDRFTSGKFELSAQVSAVAVKQGASKDIAYESGVAVFTLPKGGLMAEASVGGQAFSFEPK